MRVQELEVVEADVINFLGARWVVLVDFTDKNGLG
jgi:hypothetical protein